VPEDPVDVELVSPVELGGIPIAGFGLQYWIWTPLLLETKLIKLGGLVEATVCFAISERKGKSAKKMLRRSGQRIVSGVNWPGIRMVSLFGRLLVYGAFRL
jgi:hypothetical protein